MGRKFFVGGNFKMNGTLSDIKTIADNLKAREIDPNTQVVLAPPSLYLLYLHDICGSQFEIAAQNIFDQDSGAFTGEISAKQLKDANIKWTLVGHSERRTILREDDSFLARKTECAIRNGVNVILCCGETLGQRDEGKTIEVVTDQLRKVKQEIDEDAWKSIVIAYEPVWAIGTGKVATTEQAQEAHAAIRQWLSNDVSSAAAESTRIIYGGSVTTSNCSELAKQKDIDGFLVGGASLKPDFNLIINANQ